MKEGGTTIATVTALDINFNNNLEGVEVLFNDTITGIASGNFMVDGTLTAQFLDATLYNKFVNNTSSSLEFTLTDSLTKTHTYAFPKIVYTSADITAADPGQQTISMKFNVQYDGTLLAKCSITRTV
jgi:hypothetical protein